MKLKPSNHRFQRTRPPCGGRAAESGRWASVKAERAEGLCDDSSSATPRDGLIAGSSAVCQDGIAPTQRSTVGVQACLKLEFAAQ